MSITAVIPVRAGSTRLKDKNIRLFAGTSLLENKIAQLRNVKEIDEIIVSSDSEEMLATAKRYGVTPKKRPIEYCDEKSRTFNEVVEYIASEEVQSEVMIWAPCVCPLVTAEKFKEGIDLFEKIKNGELSGDSVVTASLIKEYIFDEHKPVNFSVEHHVPSQMLPDWHCIKNGFFIADRLDMVRWRFVYGPNPLLCEINKYEAIDIDDEFDFEIAEAAMLFLAKKKESF